MKILATKKYKDLVLNRIVNPNEILNPHKQTAEYLIELGLAVEVEQEAIEEPKNKKKITKQQKQ